MTNVQKKILSYTAFFVLFGLLVLAKELIFSSDKKDTKKSVGNQTSEALISDILEFNAINLKKILIRPVIRSEHERFEALKVSLNDLTGRPLSNVKCTYEKNEPTNFGTRLACWKNITNLTGGAVFFVINADATQTEQLTIFPKDNLLINGVITSVENAVVTDPILADQGRLGGILPIHVYVSGNVKLVK